jgi:mannose-6-phosphate isomerase-like protein (cupin superfamily)
VRHALTTALFVALAPAASIQHTEHAWATSSTLRTKALILAKDQGDHRVRRPRPGGAGVVAAASLIIKVNQENGGSPNFFMGFEELQPGAAIVAHRHPMYDEILFIHRGTGIATLGSRTADVRDGATLYIPPGTRVGLRNTGKVPLVLLFVFPQPDAVSTYYDELTVKEGQPVKPFSSREFAAFRARHRAHIEFD